MVCVFYSKPVKTHKVAANFEDHYDDYLRDGIPDALLEGLGFSESGDQQGSDSGSPPDYGIDADMPTGKMMILCLNMYLIGRLVLLVVRS